MINYPFSECTLCPRKCKANRIISHGFCGEKDKLRIGGYRLHMWEEPVISGKSGSGTVFFSGCVLRCVFCQNFEISAEKKGYEITVDRLGEIFLELQDKGASNINLVNPTHFVPLIISALDGVKGKLKIPVVYNSGGYEEIDTLKSLAGYVDIFLPDLKYKSAELAKKYSAAPDYFEKASAAIRLMADISGRPVIENGLMKRGTIVRHLVLPGCRHDSIEAIDFLGQTFKSDEILLSVMSQYMPTHRAAEFDNLGRRVSTFEYESVLKAAQKYGFEGFSQERSSSVKDYVPEFYDKPGEENL